MQCNACHEFLDLSFFGKDKRVKSGVNGRCKRCVNKKQQEYRLNNPGRHKDIESRSRLNNKQSFAEGKKRYYENIKKDPEWQRKQKSLRASNKNIKQEYDRRYRIENRDKLNLISKQWEANNKDLSKQIKKSYKARRRGWMCFKSDATKDIFDWELAQAKYCHWCKIDCTNNYHIDHYIPLSKGGRHVLTNLVISCPTCNIRKNAKMPEEFLKEIETKVIEQDVTI